MPSEGLVSSAALLLVPAGLVAGGVVALVARAPLEGLKTLLDFLLAAGLLHLVVATGWTAWAGAAAVLGVRRLVGAGLRQGRSVLLPGLGPPGPVGGARPDGDAPAR